MASIHKRHRSPYYFASFQDATGRWLKKSTKTDDRKLALKMAIEFETLAMGGRQGAFVESQARKVISEIAKQATGRSMDFFTCRAWFEEWLKNKAGTTAKSTMVKYKQVCDGFLSHLGDRADLALNVISVSDVRSFRDTLSGEGRAASTVNTTLRKCLSVPFMAAYRLGYIAVNPVHGVEALKDDKKGTQEPFTVEQARDIIKASESDWKGANLMGFSTGLRLGDVVNLTWGAIDLKEGFVSLPTLKTGKAVKIPIGNELLGWLKKRPLGIGNAPVFPDLVGKSGGRNGLSSQFKRIMEKAEVKGRITREGTGKGRTRISLGFHSWRHTFVSVMANAEISPEIRKQLVAHSDDKSHAIYTHFEIESFRNAIAKLPSVASA